MIDVSGAGLAIAFAAGIVSFASPCVLPLIPGYVSYVSGGLRGQEEQVGARQALWPALWFVFGFTTVFVALGLSAQALGGVLQRYSIEANYIGGGLVILFGLVLTGIVKLPALAGDYRWRGPDAITGPGSAYLLGIAFAFGWTPCIGPILGAVLTVSAASATVAGGVSLLAVYSLGLGVPFVLAALFTDELAARLKAMGRLGCVLQILAGGLMVLMGIAMITGQLTVIAYWLLDVFPILANIG